MAAMIVVKDEWTIDNGLLTPTMKIKRDVLEAKYKDLISQSWPKQVGWE
jgi:long-chain acyl-CoA synthetase